jgi:exonuclease III
MRIVAWNIRAGGGRRAAAIARQLMRWQADIVALSEFRGTPPSCALAAALAAGGLKYQLTTADRVRPARNALLLAARWPLRRLLLRKAPGERCRWLAVAIAAPQPFVLGAMHVPNRAGGRKYPFLDAVLACARRWRRGPALLLGDTNSGRRGIDEETASFNAREEGWIDALAACGWRDGFRHLQTDARTYTWYSPSGRNGFRIDQAFVNASLLASIAAVRYAWGGAAQRRRRDLLSDHAALLVDVVDAAASVQVAGDAVPGHDVAVVGVEVAALGQDGGAARVEAAARRHLQRARDLAGEDDLLPLDVRV